MLWNKIAQLFQVFWTFPNPDHYEEGYRTSQIFILWERPDQKYIKLFLKYV